jgi:hypothetical protein
MFGARATRGAHCVVDDTRTVFYRVVPRSAKLARHSAANHGDAAMALGLLGRAVMRNTSFLLLFTLSRTLVACDDSPVMPDAPPGPPTIHVFSQAPQLVAFREGIDGAWQLATMTTPTNFEFEVNGPYVVSVVCQDPISGVMRTWQSANTPDDPRGLASPCRALPSEHAITGHMAQAGHLWLGDSADSSDASDWDFHLSAADGTYDLLATTDDRIALRRGIEVDGDIALMPPVDVAKEGEDFAEVAFTAANADPDERLDASVFLKMETLELPAQLYAGPIATAKVAPDSVLATVDAQSTLLRATKGTATRSVQRSFRVGGTSKYTLPPPIGGLQWAVESGRLSASWTTLPDLDSLRVSVSKSATNDTLPLAHEMEVSSRFLAATGVSHIAIDTDIRGYQPEWRIDFTLPYKRQLQVRSLRVGEIRTSSEEESLNESTDSVAPTAHLTRTRP